MTDEKKERINELEKEFAFIFEDMNNFDEKYRVIKESVYGFITGEILDGLDSEEKKTVCEYKDRIFELSRLYDELLYKPDEDEKALSYLFHDGMTTEEKLKALADAWWYATNSGYSDAMANRLMAGQESDETQLWERNCRNKQAIDRYYNYLKEEAGNA